jgi:uncharacterized protein
LNSSSESAWLRLFAWFQALAASLLITSAAEPAHAPPKPIDRAAPWRAAIYDLCKADFQHSAWGVAHCERDYLLALALAREEELPIDDEVLFAAAFLHDAGAFEPFRAEDVDHAERGAQVAGEILSKTGFPMEKLPKVQDAIRGHMFYAKVSEIPEAVVLHDADTLDFLGNIGISRILSLTSRHRWAPDLRGAIGTLRKFQNELPEKLLTKAGKKAARKRVEEMKQFLETLNDEADGGKSL